MKELTIPSVELAKSLTRELGPEEQLVGMKMSVMGGVNPSPLYSLSMTASFLEAGSYEEAISPNSRATIGYIDPSALVRWVSGVFGDQELADALQECVDTEEPFGLIAADMRELLMQRYLQCVDVLKDSQEVS